MHIRKLEASDDVSNFSCGDHDLNDYLRRYALANHVGEVNATYVAVMPDDPNRVVGYYTAAISIVKREQLPEPFKSNLPYSLVGSFLLARLARDRSYKKMGIGEALMAHFFDVCLQMSSRIHVRFIVVDAYKGKVDWYKQYGFEPIEGNTNPKYTTMFMAIETVRKAVQDGCHA